MNLIDAIAPKPLLALLMVGLCAAAGADEMSLSSGETVRGEFGGYRNHRFVFTTADGTQRTEFAASVAKIDVERPVPVTAQTINGPLNDVLFKQYEKYNVILLKDGHEIKKPATLFKQMDLAVAPAPAPVPVETPVRVPDAVVSGPEKELFAVPQPAVKPPARVERPIAGGSRWNTKQASSAKVISNGEVVDIEGALTPGAVNIVHFHLDESLTSVREGNYVEAISRKPSARLTVLRVVIPDWNAPICKELDLKSLPQFWFYSTSGKLTRKLTQRFTESDIDAAVAEARRGG